MTAVQWEEMGEEWVAMEWGDRVMVHSGRGHGRLVWVVAQQ